MSKNYQIGIIVRRTNSNSSQSQSFKQFKDEILNVIDEFRNQLLSNGVSNQIQSTNGISINEHNWAVCNDYIISINPPSNNVQNNHSNNNNSSVEDRKSEESREFPSNNRNTNNNNFQNNNFQNNNIDQNRNQSRPANGNRNGFGGDANNKAVWDINVANICYDEQVYKLICKTLKYTNIGKLWEYNPQALLTYFKASQIMGYSQLTSGINVSVNGNNGEQVRNDYKNKLFKEINKLFPKTDDSTNLDKIKRDACNIIYNKHLEIMNNEWPKSSKGNKNTRKLQLEESKVYSEYINNDKCYVTWYMSGFLSVADEVQTGNGFGFNGGKTFITSCQSDEITFKLVILKKDQMDDINYNQLKSENMMNQMKKYLVGLTSGINNGVNKSLGWDDF